MTRSQFERCVDRYLLSIRAKLMLGWDQWEDRASALPTDRIMEEMSDEAVDILGWAFWLWLKSQRNTGA